jgi:peptide/nickel transport system substrate-binding protein
MRKQLTVVALAMMLLAGACASDDGDDTPDAQSGPTTTAAPTRGGTLVVAITSDPGSLNPAVTTSGVIHPASEPMFNGLVGWGSDGKLVPELAESWTIEGGGTSYRFNLRQNVKWHDGRPFTADDVKFTFEKALLKLHSRTAASVGTAQVSIQTPDQKTVIFTFANPYAPLLQQLNVTEAPIIPKHVYEGCADLATVAGCPANKAPIGTGPFKLESYTIQEIKMVRNPDYFRPGLPYLDGLVQRVIPDQGTQLLALENKEVDWVGTVPGADVERVKAIRTVGTATAPRGSGGGNCTLTGVFNMKPAAGRPGFFTELRTRQAFWAAVNREQTFRTVSFGQGRVSSSPINSGIPFAAAPGLNLPTFDVNRAKTLLDQVGWKDEGGGVRVARNVPNVPDGTKFEIDWHGTAGDSTTYGEQIRSQVSAVGIALIVKTEDSATFASNVFAKRDFDTAVVSYCNGDDPDIGFRRQVDSRQISPAQFTNGAGYSNSQVDQLLDQATREPDQAKRTPIYRQLQEILVRELPYIWLTESVQLRAFNANCTGFNHENTGLFAEAASCKK